MRVVAGRFGGRRLRAVPGDIARPTSDRVRESLFAIIGNEVLGARVLDLYAGTGALAVEALSRGAIQAVLVETAAPSIGVIRSNLDTFGLDGVTRVRRSRVEAWLRRGGEGLFDLVLLDPPYDLPVTRLAEVLDGVARTALRPGGLLVLEARAGGSGPRWPVMLEPFDLRTYGTSALHFARLSVAGFAPDGAKETHTMNVSGSGVLSGDGFPASGAGRAVGRFDPERQAGDDH